MTALRAKVTQKRLFFVLRCGAWISRWDDLVFAADLTAAAGRALPRCLLRSASWSWRRQQPELDLPRIATQVA